MEEIYYPKKWIYHQARTVHLDWGPQYAKNEKIQDETRNGNMNYGLRITTGKGKQEEAWMQLEANRESTKKLKDNQYANNSITI